MEQRNPRLRWLVVWVLAVVWMVAVLARLSYLQLFCYSEYLAKAQHQQQRIFEISPEARNDLRPQGPGTGRQPPDGLRFRRSGGNHAIADMVARLALPRSGCIRRRNRNENPRSANARAAGARNFLPKPSSEFRT